MKKYRIQITTILLLACFSLAGFAQDKRTLDTKVADVLAQMPTKNLTHRDKAMNDIFLMGNEGYQKLAAQLVPLGTGDDTAVRFALNSFSRYASQFGKCEERASAEDNLLKALSNANDVEVKTYLLNQLNLVAGEKTVEQVKSYLTDEQLAEPATQTILSTEDPKTAEVFLAAFPKIEGETQMTIVRALGRLKCKHAVPLITPLVSSESKAMQKTTLAALANIGSPDSYKTLLKAASDVDFNYEATNAAEAFLTYTKRLGEQNELELMEKACKAIFKANSASNHLHNYSTALRIYADNLGYEATPLLLKAVDSPDKAFRYAALNIAENLGGVADTRKWIAIAEAAKPEVKAEIIDMLGRRGCLQANDFVLASLDSNSDLVRTEAITALAKLQGNKAIPILTVHLAKGNDIETSKKVLNTLLDKDHLYLIAGNLDQSTGKTKAAFIDLIGAKAGTQYFDEILTATSSADADEKAAAFAALKQVSSYENTDALLKLLLAVSDSKEIAETQWALIAAVDGVAAEQESTGKVLSRLEQTNKKARLFPILPTIGGETALETITGYFSSSTGEQKEAAFTALTNWQDYSASKPLYEICQSGNATFSQPAFNSFVRMVASANLPDDQKLLQYRKIMNYASSADDKKNVIAAIGRLKTFLSLVYLEQYMEEDELTETTARAIMNIAMPDSNGEGGLTGDIVRRILGKAEQALSGEDSAYDKINIQNYLNDMPKDKGYVSMFNGKNLDGWQGMLLDGNPIKIAKLTDAERAKEQEAANIKMRENWSVKDGMIIFSGKGANLVSKKIYKDFDMIVDWRISKKGDSGIYLRGAPQVQVWDTSRVEVGAQVGSGGLYNNNPDNVRDPLLVADNPIDEWNTFRITMVGENVTVYLNGELVVDNVKMDNYWDRSIPIFSEGTIELQAHGNELAFRDVYVREINTDEIGLTQEEIGEGFVSLFNGKNLDGWQGNKTDYYAENGELVVNPKAGGHGNLYTEKEYSDFVFRFEFKLTPGANNGLGIRTPLEGDAAYVGMELQILDNTAPIYANLHEYQYHGSVYGTIPAKRGYLNPVGDWNTQEVVVKGTKIKITLNGEVILDGDLADARKNGTPDGKEHPGLQREKGFIGFLGHGSELWFRNIRIKELSE
ncbi:family 16 glycoside hydrolase [Draconibacterium halophilum]|uniref:DUF1080 domain-containing protein n=1 Tax=Draconibacterium halophilum TaxID=2706887 RepID=A0A6C0RA08_9BACT|nr:family 16 glycoside hydrolase [Draconibacterium halophilum]QIA06812.1 DUF1080 domain-containing protein [Draconibacterium halophilum]